MIEIFTFYKKNNAKSFWNLKRKVSTMAFLSESCLPEQISKCKCYLIYFQSFCSFLNSFSSPVVFLSKIVVPFCPADLWLCTLNIFMNIGDIHTQMHTNYIQGVWNRLLQLLNLRNIWIEMMYTLIFDIKDIFILTMELKTIFPQVG